MAPGQCAAFFLMRAIVAMGVTVTLGVIVVMAVIVIVAMMRLLDAGVVIVRAMGGGFARVVETI